MCEGAKTETSYFRGLKTAGRLTSVVVRPSRAGQAGPRGLWERARFELRSDPGWDEIYCVLDCDGRDSAVGDLEGNLAVLDRRNRSTRVEMILSDPCFEFWLLLHFELTDRPFVAAGKERTACDEVIDALRRHCPRYTKNQPRIYEWFQACTEFAVSNAEGLEGLERRTSDSSSRSPRTDVGRLVDRLGKISGR